MFACLTKVALRKKIFCLGFDCLNIVPYTWLIFLWTTSPSWWVNWFLVVYARSLPKGFVYIFMNKDHHWNMKTECPNLVMLPTFHLLFKYNWPLVYQSLAYFSKCNGSNFPMLNSIRDIVHFNEIITLPHHMT